MVFQLVVIGILLWAGVGLVVGVLALLAPVIGLALLLAPPGLESDVTTLLAIIGGVHWLMALTTVLACGGLLYAGNWLLYQGRRSVGPTVLLITWTLFAVPSLLLSPVPFLFQPLAQAVVALLCLEVALALGALVLGLGLRFYLHSEGVWSTLC
jgi:hypothetical protein